MASTKTMTIATGRLILILPSGAKRKTAWCSEHKTHNACKNWASLHPFFTKPFNFMQAEKIPMSVQSFLGFTAVAFHSQETKIIWLW